MPRPFSLQQSSHHGFLERFPPDITSFKSRWEGAEINFNFNSVQLALVLEDYEPPALRVQGFVSRKKGARSIVEEKKEGEKKIIIMIIKKVK